MFLSRAQLKIIFIITNGQSFSQLTDELFGPKCPQCDLLNCLDLQFIGEENKPENILIS